MIFPQHKIYQIMSVSRNKNLIRKRWRIQAEVFVMWIYFHFKFFGCHFDLIFILIIIIITKNFFLTQVPGIFRYVRHNDDSIYMISQPIAGL
jgi:hypothetical protein